MADDDPTPLAVKPEGEKEVGLRGKVDARAVRQGSEPKQMRCRLDDGDHEGQRGTEV